MKSKISNQENPERIKITSLPPPPLLTTDTGCDIQM